MKRALLLAALVISCNSPESQSPLSPPDAAVLDEKLIGTWEGNDGDEKTVMHVTQRAGGVMTVVIRGDHGTAELWAHVTKLKNGTYLSARQHDGERLSGWFIGRYTLDKAGNLTVYALRRDAVPDEKLTWSSEKLVAFLEAGKPDSLFEKLSTLKRRGK